MVGTDVEFGQLRKETTSTARRHNDWIAVVLSSIRVDEQLCTSELIILVEIDTVVSLQQPSLFQPSPAHPLSFCGLVELRRIGCLQVSGGGGDRNIVHVESSVPNEITLFEFPLPLGLLVHYDGAIVLRLSSVHN